MSPSALLPKPTAAQSKTVLDILEAWVTAGYEYRADAIMRAGHGPYRIFYTNPDDVLGAELVSRGVTHFDALCQATAAMQILLELFP